MVTLLVLGIVFIVSPSVKLTRRPFLRDVVSFFHLFALNDDDRGKIFYLLAVAAFFIIVMDKKVYLWESGLFVCFYLMYVLL